MVAFILFAVFWKEFTERFSRNELRESTRSMKEIGFLFRSHYTSSTTVTVPLNCPVYSSKLSTTAGARQLKHSALFNRLVFS